MYMFIKSINKPSAAELGVNFGIKCSLNGPFLRDTFINPSKFMKTMLGVHLMYVSHVCVCVCVCVCVFVLP